MSLLLFRGAAAMIGLMAISPAAAQSAAPPEECVGFNTAAVESRGVGGFWTVRAGQVVLLKHYTRATHADRAVHTIQAYGFDQQCFVGGRMMYWKSKGQIPAHVVPGQDCVTVDPAEVRVSETGGSWMVMSGQRLVAEYGQDRAGADRAVQVIKTHKLTQQCHVIRPTSIMTYWIAA